MKNINSIITNYCLRSTSTVLEILETVFVFNKLKSLKKKDLETIIEGRNFLSRSLFKVSLTETAALFKCLGKTRPNTSTLERAVLEKTIQSTVRWILKKKIFALLKDLLF